MLWLKLPQRMQITNKKTLDVVNGCFEEGPRYAASPYPSGAE
ncbi:hypothetical protein BH11PSE13_BH11PSE13_10730 [soil metagenome]